MNKVIDLIKLIKLDLIDKNLDEESQIYSFSILPEYYRNGKGSKWRLARRWTMRLDTEPLTAL